jgi:hypothetical protein
MKRLNNWGRIIVVLGWIILIYLFWKSAIVDQPKLEEDYSVINFETEFNGIVKDAFIERGFLGIELTNGKKISDIHYRIRDNNNKGLGLYLKEYDKLEKKSKSDTIVVIREGVKTIFILRQ